MTSIPEPSFETISSWALTGGGGFSAPTQNTHWASDGTYSMKFIKPSGKQYGGAYARASVSVNFDSNFKLRFDYHTHRSTSETSGYNAPELQLRVLVDYQIIESFQPGEYGTFLDHNTPLISGFSGTHTLRLEYWLTDWYDTLYEQWLFVDNLRVVDEAFRTDVYVNSVSGNDSYAGDSCVAGHPVLTFAKAYELLASGGTIHICNSGADFSGETVTLSKSFSTDLNGASGYFYMPKAS